MHGILVHMPVKLLHDPYQVRPQQPHLNNRLLLLSTFLPHDLNLRQLPRNRQHPVPLFCRRCFKRVRRCGSFRRASPGPLLLQISLLKSCLLSLTFAPHGKGRCPHQRLEACRSRPTFLWGQLVLAHNGLMVCGASRNLGCRTSQFDVDWNGCLGARAHTPHRQAISARQLRHDHKEPRPTEFCAGCSCFLPSSGCDKGRYY